MCAGLEGAKIGGTNCLSRGSDFGTSSMIGGDITALMQSWQAGGIGHDTLVSQSSAVGF
jgi:hypothetical protein